MAPVQYAADGRLSGLVSACYQAVDARRESTYAGQGYQPPVLLVYLKDVDARNTLPVLVGVQHVQESPVATEIQVGRACEAREGPIKRHAGVFAIDRVKRDGAADRIDHVGKAPVLAHDHPAGTALIRGHGGAHKLNTVVGNDVR